MPNALLEAMAMGKACVATNVNGSPELVEHGISGFLVHSESVDELFDRIDQLLRDEELKKKFETNALARVEKSFTVDKMIDQLEKLFLQQLQKSR
jgi:glycosyltransferase involved in cell wall biosynthesis